MCRCDFPLCRLMSMLPLSSTCMCGGGGGGGGLVDV